MYLFYIQCNSNDIPNKCKLQNSLSNLQLQYIDRFSDLNLKSPRKATQFICKFDPE